MIDRIVRAIRRRPVRVAEAVVAVAALAGYVIAPEVEEGITTLVVGLLAIFGGEAAQRHTTSKRYPRDDDGTPMVPGDAEHALESARAAGAFDGDPDLDDDPEAL